MEVNVTVAPYENIPDDDFSDEEEEGDEYTADLLNYALPPQQQQYPVIINNTGKEVIVQTPIGYFTHYAEYFQNLRGKYEEIYEPYAASQWTFTKRREQEVRNLINQILSGQLPPPSQLAQANQINIDLSAPSILPISQPLNQPLTQVIPMTNIQPPLVQTSGRGRGRKKIQEQQPLSLAPSQIIASTLGPQTMQTSTPNVIRQAPELPAYDPTEREAGESQEEYKIRVFLYNYLLSNNITPDYADTLSRMRNNVDVLGVGYNQVAMNVLNAYLPRS
jgi:hypothetical protein